MKILDYSAVVSCSAVLFLAAANLEVQQEDNHYFEIRDEAGVPTAVTTGGPRFTGELFSFELVLTLAQDPAEIESLISSATGFAMTGDGLFVVVDNKWAGGGYSVARLVLFGPDGRYLRSMGRVGEGPGEFQGMLIEAVHGDTVEVYDDRLRRLTRYRTNGDLLETSPAPIAFEMGYSQLYKSADGNYIALDTRSLNREHVFSQFWIVEPGGVVLTHYRTPDVKNAVLVDMGGPRAMPAVFPYAPVPVAVYLPDVGIALSPGMEPIIDIYGLDGRLKHRIRVENLSLGIASEDIARFDALWEDRLSDMPEGARPDARKQRNSLRNAMPTTKPPWTYISVDDRGYWWLRIQDEPDPWTSWDKSYTYHLLSPEGEYLGDTITPPTFIRSTSLHRTYPVSIRNGHFLTMENDPETGEQFFNVYRMVPTVKGFQYR